MIVDDESSTRNGLMKHVDWNELGVDFVEEAKDGFEGLEIVESFQPDIIISDIRMPGMNGIEFATRIRTLFPACRIIFISGYSDKEYLKAAIHLNAVSYVEKPIEIDELKDVVKKAVALHIEDEKKKLTEESIHLAFSESLPFIKQKIAFNLINSRNVTEDILKDLRLVDVNFKVNDPYTVFIIRPAFRPKTSNEEKLTGSIKILNLLEELVKDIEHLYVIKEDVNIIVITSYSLNMSRRRFITIFDDLKTWIKENNSDYINLFCAVGQTVKGMNYIRESYGTAVLALQKLFFRGYGHIVFYENKTEKSFSFNERIPGMFAVFLQESNMDAITAFIDNLCRDIKLSEGTLADEVKNLFLKLSSTLFREAEKRGINPKDAGEQEEKHLLSMISDFQTIQELKEYLVNKTNFVLESIKDIDSTSRTVLNAIKYIRENYADTDLSVKRLADFVYLTPTYLSTLFKKETGKTISDFVIDVRIEKSKDLLMDPQIKLFEVARKIGYSDANYYAKAFKKQLGLTPSAFREKYIL